jgi:hypothetical protein
VTWWLVVIVAAYLCIIAAALCSVLRGARAEREAETDDHSGR